MKNLILIALLFLHAAVHAAPPLRVGMEMSYPPFEIRDTAGEPAGVSVDLARALGAKLGRPVEFTNFAFDGLVPALRTSKIDVIISSMTATEERAKNVDFTTPYLRTGLCLLISAKSPIQSAADLDREGQKLAVIKGTTGHLWAAANVKNATILVMGKETAGVLEVTQGKADAFIYDQMSTLRNWMKNRDTTRAILAPLKEEGWAAALRKGDPLRAQLDEALAALRKEGFFDQLAEKWLKEQKAEFQRLGVPFVF